ncbi:hypothetical protein KKG72_11600 [bacterium]|nr:hypothetical protein [bacterium]MBU1994729.1 hypothetical protein [bacterium]
MRVLVFLTLFFSFVFADFFIVSEDKKVKMTSLATGKIDFSTFSAIAKVERGNKELHAMGDEIAFNHRHLNFRLATIDLVQSNYTITEWSEKAQDSSNDYYINFADYTREDGVMLQLFYKNKWYAVVLGEPLEILQKLFSQDGLEAKVALEKIKRARLAFKEDEMLQKLEAKFESLALKQIDKNAKYKKQEAVDFSNLKK